ncbi:MAG: tetratricopeptide repeat protein [Rhodocyclales bacterium]|nr:tetratricopeptide repeat protein [Rhodocyclales bacterium]
MSLINQMLRDLDEREASALERNGLAAQVRALPREKGFPWASVLPIAVGAGIAAAGIWLAHDASSPAPASAPSAPPMPIAPSPAAMAMPVLVVPMPTEPPEAVAEPAAQPVADALHLDYRISQPPRAAEAPVAPVAAAPVPPAPSVQIDKRPLAPHANTAEAEYRKALAAHRQGRPGEAAEGFQGALRLDARHVSARQALLSLLLEQQRWPEAQAVAAEGLALLPAQPGWAMILARLQVEQGQLAAAEQTMATHAPHGERNPDYQAFHGLLLEKLQRPQEARAAFLRARDLGNLPPELAAAVEERLR